MDRLRRRENIKAHRARFGALPPHAMPDRLPDILRHQGLELVFRPLMVEKGLAGVAKQGGELRPGIRGAHIDDADRLDARPRRFNAKEARGLAVLDAAPEFLFRG